MCRNIFVIGVKPEIAKEKLWQFLIAAKPYMSFGQNDGLGYAALGRGGIWGERWLDPSDGFVNETRIVKDKEKKWLSSKYNTFGTIDSEGTSSVLMHTRYATCEKNLENVHPFVIGNTALVHNGVISNQEKLKNTISTCDSECILNEYLDADVVSDPDNIQKVSTNVKGSFACGVLTKGHEGRYYVDVFRNYGSSLHAMYVNELETVVICTSAAIIEETCKTLGWTHGASFRFNDDRLVRFDAITGELILTKPFTYSLYQNDYKGNNNYYNWNKHREEEEKKSLLISKAVQDLQQAVEETSKTNPSQTKTSQDSLTSTGNDDYTDPFYGEYEGYRGD